MKAPILGSRRPQPRLAHAARATGSTRTFATEGLRASGLLILVLAAAGACRGASTNPGDDTVPANSTPAAATTAAAASQPLPAKPAPADSEARASEIEAALKQKAVAAVAKPAAGASAAASSQGQGTTGPTVTGEGYEAFLRSTAVAVSGQVTPLQVVLKALPPFKCNVKYPYKFKLNAAPGIAETTFREMAVDKTTGTLSFPFTPNQPGQVTLSGTLSFSVCTDDKCLIDRAELTLTLPVGAS